MISQILKIIIGTQSPWIEAISYELNASKIITLDYTRKYWHEEKLEWHHVNDYLDEMLKEQLLEQIDNSVSFSSIEHAGLGRYGDPLSPDGDIDAVKEIHCMLKPGGLLILGGLPYTGEEEGNIMWNAHRIYGKKRIKRLSIGWEMLEDYDSSLLVDYPYKHHGFEKQTGVVLKKIGKC